MWWVHTVRRWYKNRNHLLNTGRWAFALLGLRLKGQGFSRPSLLLRMDCSRVLSAINGGVTLESPLWLTHGAPECQPCQESPGPSQSALCNWGTTRMLWGQCFLDAVQLLSQWHSFTLHSCVPHTHVPTLLRGLDSWLTYLCTALPSSQPASQSTGKVHTWPDSHPQYLPESLTSLVSSLVSCSLTVASSLSLLSSLPSVLLKLLGPFSCSSPPLGMMPPFCLDCMSHSFSHCDRQLRLGNSVYCHVTVCYL